MTRYKGYGKLILFNLLLFLLLDRVAGTLYFKKVNAENQKRKSGVRIPHPDYHHGLKPSLRVVESWGDYSFQLCTNSLGLRDREPRQVPWTTSKTRVVWMGDSFTEGLAMEYDDCFVGLFAKHADTGVEHLNMGVVSYSPEIYARKLKHYLDKGLKVDKLVVCPDISDMQDEIKYHNIFYNSPSIHFYMDADKGGMETPASRSRLDSLAYRFGNLYRNTHSLTLQLLDRLPRKQASDGKEGMSDWDRQYEYERAHVVTDSAIFRRWGGLGLSYMGENMDKILKMSGEKSFNVEMVIYPWPEQILSGAFINAYTRFWEDYCARKGIRLINLFPGFQALSERIGPGRTVDSLYIRNDMHWTKAGNRFVYEEIRKSLR
jgi:hypothetical protein